MEAFLENLAGVWSPHSGQREFLLHPAKIKVLACGRRWGKTEVCAVQTLFALSRPNPTRHLIIAPTLEQARILFDRLVQLLGQVWPDEPIKVRTSPFPSLRMGEHLVTARSGHLGRSLRGQEATSIVIDEAAYLPEELITEIAMPMLATTDGNLHLISTPNGQNHFWRFFEMGRAEENGVWSRRAASRESPHVSVSYLEVQRELISERAYRVEYEAEFIDSAGRVFRTESIDACLVTQLTPVECPFTIGVDWARYSDYTAVVVLAGNTDSAQLVERLRFHGQNWAQTVGRVAELVERYPEARVLCDETGVGDPVLEMLKDACPSHAVEGLGFSLKVKHELINGLAVLVDRGAIRMLPDPEIIRELSHFESRVSSSGNIRLQAVSGYHDDLVIALALAARGLVKPYGVRIAVGEPRKFSKDSAKEKP